MKEQATAYISDTECLVIPCNSNSKYHYWNGGQPLTDTLLDLNATENVWGKYILTQYPGKTG